MSLSLTYSVRLFTLFASFFQLILSIHSFRYFIVSVYKADRFFCLLDSHGCFTFFFLVRKTCQFCTVWETIQRIMVLLSFKAWRKKSTKSRIEIALKKKSAEKKPSNSDVYQQAPFGTTIFTFLHLFLSVIEIDTWHWQLVDIICTCDTKPCNMKHFRDLISSCKYSDRASLTLTISFKIK